MLGIGIAGATRRRVLRRHLNVFPFAMRSRIRGAEPFAVEGINKPIVQSYKLGTQLVSIKGKIFDNMSWEQNRGGVRGK